MRGSDGGRLWSGGLLYERKAARCLAQVYLPAGPPAWYKVTDGLLSGTAPLGAKLKVSTARMPGSYLNISFILTSSAING